MQHFVHIFIGEDLVTFRDNFAKMFRNLHPDIEPSMFSALSLTVDETGNYHITPDMEGDSQDGAEIEKQSLMQTLFNYLEDIYGRKVTVAHQGNQSLVLSLWSQLFRDDVMPIVKTIIESVKRSESNIHIELNGFTHDAVSCFIENSNDRLSTEVYKSNFEANIKELRNLRQSFIAVSLIANRNINNVSLNLNIETLARICAEQAALMSEHYISIRKTVCDYISQPFESFGISSVIFDVRYYKEYLKARVEIDKMKEHGIDTRSFNINALALITNPVIRETLDEIYDFYTRQTASAEASLIVTGKNSASNLVGKIDSDVKNIIANLEERITKLFSEDKISIFECEALLSLILGEDCHMFDSSSVSADELIVDDIIDKSIQFYISLEDGKKQKSLNKVTSDDLKKMRTNMRNISINNRILEQRLEELHAKLKENDVTRRIEGPNFQFDNTDYKVDLVIDREPLDKEYKPHDVKVNSVDLRNYFGPIRNQGSQGACASFAVSSVIESLAHENLMYSPAFLYWCAREVNNKTESDCGASLHDVIKVSIQKGVCDEDSMPYDVRSFDVPPSNEAFQKAEECLVIDAQTVKPKIKHIKSALDDGYPVIVGTKIFDSFTDTNRGFVPHPSDEELERGRSDGHGVHALVICGFSEKAKVLVARNSWGEQFGDNGYCYIPYSYAEEFFLEACITTQLSQTNSTNEIGSKHALNFDMSDSAIEVAIVRNLIGENERELKSIQKAYCTRRSQWLENDAFLGNVNNQAQLIKEKQDDLDKQIQELENAIDNLQNNKSEKLRQHKRSYIACISCIAVGLIGSGILTYFIPSSVSVWLTALFALGLIILISRFGYSWRRFRQDLRDEIIEYSQKVDMLKGCRNQLEIDSHIYGTILRETNNYKAKLMSKLRTLRRFNKTWVDNYTAAQSRLENMTPVAPYPFLAILDNELLNEYYTHWHDKMLKSLSLREIYNEFERNKRFERILEDNKDYNKSLMRGLQGFGMREYIVRHESTNWHFLPPVGTVDSVLADIDSRANPFSPYRGYLDRPLEKYIFIHEYQNNDETLLSRHFSQPPSLLSHSDPYSITVMNIVRFNLPD